MSKLALSIVVVLFTLSGQAFAGTVASDCAIIEDEQAPAGMCNRIQEAAAVLNQYQPPQPCVSEEEKTFTARTPASVCDSSGGTGGGSGGVGQIFQ